MSMLPLSGIVVGLGFLAIAAVGRAAAPGFWALLAVLGAGLPARVLISFRMSKPDFVSIADERPVAPPVNRAEPFELRDPVESVSALDELVRRARPIPYTRRVRIRRDRVYGLLDEMRVALPFFMRELNGYRKAHPPDAAAILGHTDMRELLSQVDEIEETVHRAPGVPLVGLIEDEVAVNRVRLAALVEDLRSSIDSAATTAR